MDNQTAMSERIFDDSAAAEREKLNLSRTCEIGGGGHRLESQGRSAEARARLKCAHASCATGLSAQGLVRHGSRLCAVLVNRRTPLPHAENRVLLGLVP
jgi:hypothetical protein